MAERAWVRELMLPVAEYATVDLDSTLQQALRGLAASRESAAPGRHPHRSVLVQRQDGTIAGWLGYHSILAALRPEQRSMVLDDQMRRAGVSEDLMIRSMEALHELQPDLPSLGDRACSIKVRNLLLTRPETVPVDATLNDLIDHFLAHHAQSLLVVDGSDVVGIVRIGDLFDEVTRLALLNGEGS